jgi:glycerol transport system ATP-binding protein
MARIALDKLAHSYLPDPRSEADFAVKQIDHVWQDGGAYALLGPSGCGKTTLLNIISGLLVPSRGKILFNDQDVTHLAPEQRNIAQVFQFPVVYDTMTVAENLAFPLANRRVPKDEIKSRVAAALEMLDLAGKADRKARNLTADEKQKISLGRGLVRYDVNAILFDEPLTVIDPHMKWQLRTELKALHRRFGHTMIYVTHDQTEALTFADKVVVMYEGEVVQIGTPEELFDEPAHTFVGYFIGSPGMNVLPCEVAGDRVRFGGREVALDRGYPPLEGRTEVGIRPEFVRLSRAGEGLPIEVARVEDIGRFKIVRASLDGHGFDAVLPEGSEVPADATAVVDPARINIYRDSHLVRGESRREP